MKDHIFLVNPHFIEEKGRKILEMSGEISFAQNFEL